MKIQIEKTNEKRSIENASMQKKYTDNSTVPFVDNRPTAIIQEQTQKSINNPVQRMKAYDETNPLTDPRHFSTPGIKEAIDACVANGTVIPGWLRDQALGYLQNELNERHQDMQRHGGGDVGHQYYLGLVHDYADKVDSLQINDSKGIPTDETAIQL